MFVLKRTLFVTDALDADIHELGDMESLQALSNDALATAADTDTPDRKHKKTKPR
jgi:hypothetical protein